MEDLTDFASRLTPGSLSARRLMLPQEAREYNVDLLRICTPLSDKRDCRYSNTWKTEFRLPKLEPKSIHDKNRPNAGEFGGTGSSGGSQYDTSKTKVVCSVNSSENVLLISNKKTKTISRDSCSEKFGKDITEPYTASPTLMDAFESKTLAVNLPWTGSQRSETFETYKPVDGDILNDSNEKYNVHALPTREINITSIAKEEGHSSANKMGSAELDVRAKTLYSASDFQDSTLPHMPSTECALLSCPKQFCISEAVIDLLSAIDNLPWEFLELKSSETNIDEGPMDIQHMESHNPKEVKLSGGQPKNYRQGKPRLSQRLARLTPNVAVVACSPTIITPMVDATALFDGADSSRPRVSTVSKELQAFALFEERYVQQRQQLSQGRQELENLASEVKLPHRTNPAKGFGKVAENEQECVHEKVSGQGHEGVANGCYTSLSTRQKLSWDLQADTPRPQSCNAALRAIPHEVFVADLLNALKAKGGH